ncbi:response regulator [bacterium]|nr:response regulator [bacterium]MBU1919972.1 response regulator [bacterium]
MARILVIDDDEDVRNMLRRILEHDGHEVSDAANGDLGLRQYRANPADLVITDIIMPEKEGIETIRELRREFPDVRIIAISGGGRVGPSDYLNAARMMGAKRTFTKPFSRQEILDCVHELCGDQ